MEGKAHHPGHSCQPRVVCEQMGVTDRVPLPPPRSLPQNGPWSCWAEDMPERALPCHEDHFPVRTRRGRGLPRSEQMGGYAFSRPHPD